MPVKGGSKQVDRSCLVCGETTRIAHLGIDACRACAVFYRRNKTGHDFVCRSVTSQCPAGKGINCKKCRFDHIERFLNKHVLLCELPSPSSTDQSMDTIEPVIQPSSPPTAVIPTRSERPIIERLKTHYRTMSMVRLHTELHARPNPPHPMEISLETGPFYPATFQSMSVANRVFLSALVDFATCAFPEFGQLQPQERWNLVVSNFYRLRHFEGCYRAGIAFPDDMDRKFGGYTLWMSAKGMENFYDDAEEQHKAKAIEHAKYSAARLQEISQARELIKRVNPCHEEFLVVAALMFWSFGETGDMPVRNEITQIGDRYREAILKELHAFYREELHLDDYATRLGDLMLFMPVFDVRLMIDALKRTHDLKEHFETLRLLGIFPEDNFAYQLQK